MYAREGGDQFAVECFHNPKVFAPVERPWATLNGLTSGAESANLSLDSAIRVYPVIENYLAMRENML